MTRFLLPLVLLTAAPLAADTLTQRQGPATLELHFPGPAPSLGLADLLAVTLTIEGDASMRVRAPTELAAGEPWQLIERSEPQRTHLSTERVRWQMRYRFAPRAPGKTVPFAFPEVVLRDKNDEDLAIPFEPIECRVVTMISAKESGKLRGITGIEPTSETQHADFDWRWLTLAALSLGILALAVVIRFVLLRRRNRSHAQIALYEWQRLRGELRLPEQNRSERFITLLSVLVRRYLEREFDFPARRLTTPELMQKLARISALNGEDKRLLCEFLQCSEAVKFANQVMSFEGCQRWSEAVEQFLQGRSARPQP